MGPPGARNEGHLSLPAALLFYCVLETKPFITIFQLTLE